MTELWKAVSLCAAFELGKWERQFELQRTVRHQLPIPDSLVEAMRIQREGMEQTSRAALRFAMFSD